MSIPGLTADEAASLRTYLLAAIDRPCIPEWEFDSLIGCSRAEAQRRVDAELGRIGHDEQLLHQVIALLSTLAGAGQLPSGELAPAPEATRALLDELIQKLSRIAIADDHHVVRQSSVALRSGAKGRAVPLCVSTPQGARKRRA